MSTTSRRPPGGKPPVDPTADGAMLDSPTQLMKWVLKGPDPLEPEPPSLAASDAGDDTTGTVSVMLRVLPPTPALLVTRDQRYAEVARPAMEAAGLEVQWAHSDSEAIEFFKAGSCPIVVTDTMSPVSRLRGLAAESYLYVLLVSDDEWDARDALRHGADDRIAVHATRDELRARLTTARRVADLESVLRTALHQNRRLSTVDELTGVANRRFFTRHFPREVARAARYRRGVSVVMCDIDHFKKVNDTWGHGAGDEVLCEFGRRVQSCLRRGIDWVARLGGEEFAFVLPDTDSAAALAITRRLRSAVRDTPFACAGTQIPITASFGMCSLDQVVGDTDKLVERMLSISDEALYNSKNAGRDRLTIARIKPEAAA